VGDSLKPKAIDLFCGLGGWTDGLLAEGYDVTGYDIEEHAYGDLRYQGNLVLQDVATLHGAQFADVALIVASPPCQEYSYMAMPWKRAKAKAAAIRADETGEKLAALNRLFNECFRIQREASFAAGRHIPMVVENVRGAQPWVGRARWSFGSFYLWGDVPALMPMTKRAVKVGGLDWKHPDDPRHRKGQAFNPAAQGRELREERALKTIGHINQRDGFDHTRHLTNPAESSGIKQGGDWFNAAQPSMSRLYGSKSPQRKAASAQIAMIPITLSRYIAATYRPA